MLSMYQVLAHALPAVVLKQAFSHRNQIPLPPPRSLPWLPSTWDKHPWPCRGWQGPTLGLPLHLLWPHLCLLSSPCPHSSGHPGLLLTRRGSRCAPGPLHSLSPTGLPLPGSLTPSRSSTRPVHSATAVRPPPPQHLQCLSLPTCLRP